MSNDSAINNISVKNNGKVSNFDTDYQFKKKDQDFDDYSEKIADELAKSAY